MGLCISLWQLEKTDGANDRGSMHVSGTQGAARPCPREEGKMLVYRPYIAYPAGRAGSEEDDMWRLTDCHDPEGLTDLS